MTSSNLIFHVPHSSTIIPESYLAHFSLDDDQLLEEVRRMTDWHTAELFGSAIETLGSSVEFPVSRLLVDPERFPDDAQECMAAVGMGVLYTKTSDGKALRSQEYTSGDYRSRLLREYFFPHHDAFHQLVESALSRTGSALIIDCHSFPSVPLPYEFDQNTDRPDICIGTDVFHTPIGFSDRLRSEFSGMGYSVELNAPFSGTIVPQQFYQTNPAVKSVMIEVNRGLYMNEETTEKIASFLNVRRDIASALDAVFVTEDDN